MLKTFLESVLNSLQVPNVFVSHGIALHITRYIATLHNFVSNSIYIRYIKRYIIVTTLHRYNATTLQRYIDTSIQNYICSFVIFVDILGTCNFCCIYKFVTVKLSKSNYLPNRTERNRIKYEFFTVNRTRTFCKKFRSIEPNFKMN